jgi:cell pole-organizing protein PopZ
MTKLDPAGEPSMDEILASIRRIIAEEPPGSRAQPEAPVPARKEAASAQAELPSMDVTPAPAQRNEPVFSSSEFGASPFAVAARQPDVRQQDFLPRLSPTGKREVEAIPHGGAEPSIDTQLADVLGAVRSVTADGIRTEPTFAMPGREAAESPATNVQAAIDSLAAPKSAAADVEPQALPARPGFTVSRDGFIPPAEQPRAEPAADPFEFTLGPSPFARKPVSPLSPEAEAADARPADPFGSLVPSRDMLSIDRAAAESAQAAPAASAPFAAAPVPEARQQPDSAAMRSSYAPVSQPGPLAEPPAESRAAFEPAPAAPAPAAFVPAAAAPQPAPPPAAFSRPQQQPGLDSRPYLSGPSLSEIATPSAPAPAWPPVSEAKSAMAPAATPAAAFEVAPAPASAPSQPASPAFTASIFASPPVAPVAAPASASPAPAAFEQAMPAQDTRRMPEMAAPATAATRDDITSPPSASIAEPAAALLEQLARSSSAVAPEPLVQPAREPIAEPAAAPSSISPAPAAQADGEPAAAEHVEAILEPAAEAAAPAEQDADFEDHGQGAEASPHSAEPAPRALVTNSARETAAAPPANEGHMPRTMEDTVADLLRPMLRSWLSENMPRIVERALRKELEESNRTEHKSAAE